MPSDFSYSTTYILDKPHFRECYEQSLGNESQAKNYQKALFLIIVGAGLVVFSQLNPYASWFIFSLGVLEVVSIYYRQAWWVTRQMLSRAAGSEVTLTINDAYLSAKSFYGESTFEWCDNPLVTATDKGWIIQRGNLKNYISNSCLSEEAQAFIGNQASEKVR